MWMSWRWSLTRRSISEDGSGINRALVSTEKGIYRWVFWSSGRIERICHFGQVAVGIPIPCFLYGMARERKQTYQVSSCITA
jgi:hypothetical protein